MNRAFLPEAVLGITVGLLLAVLAVYRTTKAPSKGVQARGAVMGLLLYAIIAAQVLVTDGLTVVELVLLLVMLCLPVAGMMLAERTPRVAGPAAQAVRAIVSIGLASAMLIAAAQTLSMLSLVDPRTLVVVVAVVTGLLVAAEGAVASGRISSLALWLLIVPILLVLVLAVFLGNVGQAISPIIITDGVPVATVVALMVALLVVGSADAALASSYRSVLWSPVRVLAGAFAVVILLVFGMLMFFGGVIIAPSVQFFVVPANIDAVPGLAGVLLAVLTLMFAAVVAHTLSGVRAVLVGEAAASADSDSGVADSVQAREGAGDLRLFALGGGVAVLVALLDPGLDWVVIATALAAAGLFGATNSRGVRAGLIGAGVLAVALTVTGAMTWGWWAALATAVVAVMGRVLSTGAQQPTPPTKRPEPVTG